MKKITKRKTLILISTGMLVIATSQLFSQFMEFTDLMKGIFMGVGIGLLLTSMIFGDFKTAE